MLKKEVEIGGVYKAKVSGVVTEVRIIAEKLSPSYMKQRRVQYRAINLSTGREVTIKSAAKLRERVS